MANLETLFLTFNCGRALVDPTYLSASLNEGLSKHQLPPDLIVLSLQEIAPISYSFLGGAFLAPYFDRFTTAVQKCAQSWSQDGLRYEAVMASNVGMTAIMVFAQSSIASNIDWTETGGTGVGMWEMGNKGAVGARLGYTAPGAAQEVELTFVAAHLAPMEDACDRRNEDWKNINENLVFTKLPKALKTRAKLTTGTSDEVEPLLSSATDEGTRAETTKVHTLITSTSQTFFGGDLNYRTSDMPPHPDDHKGWPQQNHTPSDPEHFSHLLSKDQLTRERSAGRTLHHLTEAALTFPPTYKFSSAAQEQAARKARALQKANRYSAEPVSTADDAPWLWAKHRYPSWCDRVLYLNPPFAGTQPDIRAYTALALQPSSDHKPVVLYASVPLKALPRDGAAWVSSPFQLRPDWKERRAAARRREVFVGVFAYLGLTWEGRALLVGTVLAVIGGWAALRSLLAY
ncbi:hypothetical protein MBLNU459_g7809t1 [Dothideomycetes sp. NU459]